MSWDDEGRPVEGTVTGVDHRYTESQTRTRYRVEWRDPAHRVAGIEYDRFAPAVLRLGSIVPLRVEGSLAVIDKAALGIRDEGFPTRREPAPGVTDKRTDLITQRRLRTWDRQTGTVVAVRQTSMLGMTIDHWDVDVRRPDGGFASLDRTWVPPYVHRLVGPGAPVPLAVDPKRPERALIDWPSLAMGCAGGHWRDPVVPGSIASITLG